MASTRGRPVDPEPGSHRCLLYDTEEDRRSVVGSYLRNGLELRQRIVFLADTASADPILSDLRGAGLPVDSYLASDQMLLVSGQDTLSRDGKLDPDQGIVFLSSQLERTRAGGYQALRVAVESADSLIGRPSASDLIDFDAALDSFVSSRPCLLLCSYDCGRFDSDALLTALSTHPTAILGTEAYENFYYVPPAELLAPHRSRSILDRWLANLVERRRMNQTLYESEERYRSLFESALDAVLVADDNAHFVNANPQATVLTGYSRDELLGMTVLDITAPDYRAAGREMFEQFVRTGRMQGEYRVLRKDGQEVEVEFSASRAGPGRFQSILRDITERKRAEEQRLELVRVQAAHREVEARTRLLETFIEAVPDGVLIVDSQGIVVSVNSALVELGGLASREEVLRPIAEYSRLVEFLYPDGRPMALEALPTIRALEGDTARMAEVRLRRRDGAERLVQVNAAPIRDDQGHIVYAIAVIRDVTHERSWEHQQAVLARIGQALSKELDLEAVMQTVVDQTAGILGADSVGIYTRAADRQELVLEGYRGLRPETVRLARRVRFEARSLAARAYTTGEAQVVEDVSKMGPELRSTRQVANLEGWRSVAVVPLSAAGRPIGALFLATRSTRHYGSEELEMVSRIAGMFGMAIENARLYRESQRRAEALEEEQRRREQFVSVVAHELRGPMTVLVGYAHLLRRWENIESRMRDRALQVTAEQVHKLNRLVSDLLDFSRIAGGRFAIERVSTELVSLAKEVVEEQQATTSKHQIVLVGSSSPTVGWWDRDRIAQALTNLVSNAIKYSPEGGQVRVAVARTDGEARVSVSDRGIGIAREDIPLLFQPYSRLYRERRARGVGLGLYITRGIVEAHGGRIWVESEMGRGSTFSFALPLGQAPGSPSAAERP